MPARLDLVVPGLLQPLPDWCRAGADPGRLPALELLLARSQATPFAAADPEQTLWQVLSTDDLAAVELPVARQLRGGEGYCCCADLVHLRADMRDVFLIDAAHIVFSADELAQLQSEINAHLAAVAGEIRFDAAGRGVLQFEQAPALLSTALSAVDGGGVEAHLPRGEGARWWHAQMNEIQMLLHGSVVNQRREQAGQPLLNGIWCWGGGQQAVGLSSTFKRGSADQAGSAELLSLANIRLSDQPGEVISSAQNAIVVNHSLQQPARYQEFDPWLTALQTLEETVFAPAVAALRRRQLSAINLYSADGSRYQLTRAALRAFWKPRRSLAKRFS